jgi:hypothetical protein
METNEIKKSNILIRIRMTSSKIGILGDLMSLKPMFDKVFIHGDL